MHSSEVILLNLMETRRRSIKAWRGLPDEFLEWKPDKEAFSFGEMIRHVWTSQHSYHLILLNGGSPLNDEPQPYDKIPIVSVEEEIAMAEPYFHSFLDYVRELSSEELSSKIIDRSDVGYKRSLGDMLLRIAYHDSVHTGQFLSYLRTFGLERPDIWD